MHNFRQLKIWQRSMEIVREIHLASDSFPIDEKFGIKSEQITLIISEINEIEKMIYQFKSSLS